MPEKNSSADVLDALSEQGLISQVIEGFMPRDGQQQLAGAIFEAISDQHYLVAEAGTGIGKTFAYLVPALMSGLKTLVSTGTRHLQDQLFHKDLPVVIKALDMSVDVALLKGRANYLCIQRMKNAEHMEFMTRETRMELFQVKDWAAKTSSGDISELDSVPEDARIWSMVTSTADNCLGSDCALYEECHVVLARRAAQQADIIVVNHHLLLSDMALKEEGFGELLPEVEAFIIDEAHQLPDIASNFFGQSVSSRQIMLLANDVIAEQIADAPDMGELRDLAHELIETGKHMRLAFGVETGKDAWAKIMYKPSIKSAIDDLLAKLQELKGILELAAERGKGLENCYQRCLQVHQRLLQFCSKQENSIDWYETYSRSFILHQTPLDLSERFQQQMQAYDAAWVMTSATLQVGGDFEHFAGRLGLKNYASGIWHSPFDYKNRAMIYLPEDLPEPSQPQYTHQLMQAMLPVIKSSDGRAFLLFTSYRAMNEANDFLKQRLDYPIFVQGQKPKHQLLAAFKDAGQAVLLGTSSFWEGVDVRGEALTCVMI
ncbi:MAG: ATP-dependent DNA helicase, partial [Gammaproteobacteria bacterium]|nr:ATP-dependent DNA helicase [Gammaproteobacteria bacterium]